MQQRPTFYRGETKRPRHLEALQVGRFSAGLMIGDDGREKGS